MDYEIQKASLWKRIAAGILDFILIIVLATGTGWALSGLLQYDNYSNRLDQLRSSYEERYGIDLDVPMEALSPEQQAVYKAADEAFGQDEEAIYLFNMAINLILLIVTGGILAAFIVLELIIPLLIGNGQTVGKKVFSLCLVRSDGVKMNNLQLFARTVLGKFAVETMIPVYVVIMFLFNALNLMSLILGVAVLLTQCISIIVTRNNCLLHDLMVGTVVVDYGSQKIFKSTDDLIAYQKKIAADRAARQTY